VRTALICSLAIEHLCAEQFKGCLVKVALTGVTGHLGAAVLQELLARKLTVRALVRNPDHSAQGDTRVEYVTGDILDRASLASFLDGCDTLIHCAGVISINGDPNGMVMRTNVEGTRNILEAAAKASVGRVMYASSIHAYEQKPSDEILDESRELAPPDAFAYDRSKRTGQELALSYNNAEMEVLVVNPTALIGPYDFKPSRIGRMVMNLLNGNLRFIVDGGFDFCDVRDVAHAMVNGLNNGTPGHCYLLSGKWVHLRDFVSVLSETVGSRIRVFEVPMWMAKAGVPAAQIWSKACGRTSSFTKEALVAIEDGNRRITSDRAVREIQYHIRPFDETVRDTVNWFKTRGFIK
jgi:dihydroflavonol-4-reductase